jgi:hypothetical protein
MLDSAFVREYNRDLRVRAANASTGLAAGRERQRAMRLGRTIRNSLNIVCGRGDITHHSREEEGAMGPSNVAPIPATQVRHANFTGEHTHDHAGHGHWDEQDGIHRHVHSHQADSKHSHYHDTHTDLGGTGTFPEQAPVASAGNGVYGAMLSTGNPAARMRLRNALLAEHEARR